MVPIIAAVLAAWLVWQHYSSQGIQVFVRFETASGLIQGKTEVKCRSVRVGVVEHVQLATDLQSVLVTLRMDENTESLLNRDTRFWVLRPRVSAADISGLGTLITGSYIELDPGEPGDLVKHFNGLEAPPVTKLSVPGLRLTLIAEESSALTVGSPIYYRDFEVGRVELKTFDVKNNRVKFDIFIESKYQDLVVEGVSFWNNSGLNFHASAQGFVFNTPSLTAILTGGVSFDVPSGGVAGHPVKNGTTFTLHPNKTASDQAIFNPDVLCLLFFDQSVRGLQVGAPVEFRGIKIGRVQDISLKYANPGDTRIPVLIALEPSILRNSAQSLEAENELLANFVRDGIRAKLSSSSLLTGSLFVELAYAPDDLKAELEKIGGYYVLPTQSSGLVQIEAKVNAILSKIEALKLEEFIVKYGSLAEDLSSTASEAKATLACVTELIKKKETQEIPAEIHTTLAGVQKAMDSYGPSGEIQGDLRRTLDELRAALRAFKSLSTSIEEKPNSLIFGRDKNKGVEPKAKHSR